MEIFKPIENFYGFYVSNYGRILKHARDLGLNNSIGCNNAMSKFTQEQIINIRKSEKTITLLSKELNVSIAVLSRIKSLKSYKNVK